MLDRALDRLCRYGPESRQAGANHAPMVVEALCVLGRAQAVAPWIERYERRLELRDRGGAPISRAAWLVLVSSFPGFRSVIPAVDVTGDYSRFISELTETSARHLLANEISSTASVAFLHSVTGPAALRLLVSYLRPPAAQEALRYCWQVVAALYTAFGPADSSLRHEAATLDPDDLIDRAVQVAVETSDPHAVKLVEACLREHRLNLRPVYLLAAGRGIDLLRQHPT
ncbi:MAG: hypothetical protein ACE5I7_07410 [Candidatus Binatia bacterium]